MGPNGFSGHCVEFWCVRVRTALRVQHVDQISFLLWVLKFRGCAERRGGTEVGGRYASVTSV